MHKPSCADSEGLNEVDAELDLNADAATIGDTKVEQLQTRLVMRNGTLTVEKLMGEAFGGSIDLTGNLSTRGVPSATATLRASQVAIEQLIVGGELAGQVKGPVTVSADLRTSGSSIAAPISAVASREWPRNSIQPTIGRVMVAVMKIAWTSSALECGMPNTAPRIPMPRNITTTISTKCAPHSAIAR